MAIFDEREEWKKLYPDIFVENSLIINISKLGYVLRVYNLLEKDNNYKQLKLFGLTNFKKDLKYIFTKNGFLKRQRKEKLLNILKDESNTIK